jgi:transcriptional regulator with XRE-family HTH domain
MQPHNLSLANRGEGHPQSKLTGDAVKAIFRNYPENTQKQIADAFGVSPNTVQRLLSGAGWEHLQHLNPHRKLK